MIPERVTRSGLLFLAGLEAGSTHPYVDSPKAGAPLAWGFGFNDRSVTMADRFTLRQMLERLEPEVVKREKDLNRWLTEDVTDYQFDALFGFYWQAGMLVRELTTLINRRYFTRTRQEWTADRFCMVNGKLNRGVKKRREKELKLFARGDYGNIRRFPLYRGNPRTSSFVMYELTADELKGLRP